MTELTKQIEMIRLIDENNSLKKENDKLKISLATIHNTWRHDLFKELDEVIKRHFLKLSWKNTTNKDNF